MKFQFPWQISKKNIWTSHFAAADLLHVDRQMGRHDYGNSCSLTILQRRLKM